MAALTRRCKSSSRLNRHAIASPESEKTGSRSSWIAAIHEEREPVFSDPGEEIAWRFSRELLSQRRVSTATYRAARERFGENGLMELVTLLGYYTLVSMTLNTFEVPLPEGQEPAFVDTE